MPESKGLESRVRARLDALEAGGLLRTLRPPSGIDLSSNDYLGLSRHPAIVRRLTDAIARDGCGSTGSRLLRGDRGAFHALERRFAAFKRAERSLYFGAGYLANIAVLSTVPEQGDVIVSDELNHASLIDGMRLSKARVLVFPHNDVGAAARLLESAGDAVRFLVVESLFSMQGDVAPLGQYAELSRAAGATLVVDEAHAVGVYGERGSGLLEAAGLPHDSVISINTAGKALGVAGACVAGPEWAIDYLLQRARSFVFTTAAPPALAEAIDTALDLIAAEPDRRARVSELSSCLRSRLAAKGIPHVDGRSHIVPVLIGDNDRAVAVAATLQQAGFDVRAIRPPSVPRGTARLRVSVNVSLTARALDQFVDVLDSALKDPAAQAPRGGGPATEAPLCAAGSS